MTLTRIAGSLNDLTLEGTFHVWVNRICVNAVRDYIRRRVRVRRFEERQDPTEQLATDLEAGQAAKADLTHCYRALERLSPDHRAVFVLKAVMGHSIEEIAEIMGAARSTTRLRLYYARKAFYKAMVALRPEEAE